MSTTRGPPRGRKRPIPPSVTRQIAPAPSHAESLPLFLPELDQGQGPSTSVKTPLFLPEEREGGNPTRKKRRISSKVPQLRTLNDLWNPRQVRGYLLIFDGTILITLGGASLLQQDSGSSALPSTLHHVPASAERQKKHQLPIGQGRKSGLFLFISLYSNSDKL